MRVGVVRNDRERHRLAADLPGLAGEHERVRVGDFPPGQRGSQWADLVARGHDRHPRPATNRELREAGRTRRGDVHRPQPMALGQQELGRADVLADRADVLIGRRGRLQLGLGAVEMYVLAHDHGVEAVGQRVAGVDGREVVGVEQERRRGTGAHRGGRAHGNPVHGRGVVVRRRAPCPHRLGRHAADRGLEPDALRGHARRASGRRTDLEPGGQRRRRRPIADERVSRRASPRPRSRRRGRSPARRRRRSRRRP